MGWRCKPNYTLIDNINGVDCKENSNDCYNEIKTYFSSNPSEIEKNCQTFYYAAKKDLELEQSTVRISICNNEIEEADDEVCGDLKTQVEEIKAANPDKACSAFGLGPVSGGNEQPPTCSEEEDDATTSTNISSSAYRIRVIGLLLVFVSRTADLLAAV